MDTLAQAQIELNKKYGGRLVAIAWTIEIIAASIGLFIGISSAISSIAYYQGLEGSDAMIGSTFTNTFMNACNIGLERTCMWILYWIVILK